MSECLFVHSKRLADQYKKRIRHTMKGTVRKVKTLIEPSLKDSDARYRRLFEATQVGILILDAKTGMIEDVNPYLIKMLGYSREEFIRKKLWEVAAFKDIEASKEAFEAMQEKEYLRYEDLLLKTKEGRLIQVEFVSNVYLVGGEKVVQCDIRDIAGHKQADEELQKSEKRFQALVEHSMEEISLVGSDGTLTWESPTSRRPLGYPPNSFVGHNLFDLFHPDERAAATRLLEQIVKHPGSVQEGVFRLRHQDGSWRWMEGFLTNLLDEPAVQSVVINYRDVTGRKLAEGALRESEERFRAWIENSSDLVTVVGLDGTIQYESPSIEHLLGYKPEELIGANAFDFLHPDDRERVMKIFAQNIQNSESATSVEFRTRHRDGSWRVFEGLGRAYLDEHGQMAGLINLRDITERKQAEEALHQVEMRYRALVEQTPAVIYTVDSRQTDFFTYISQQIEALSGYSPQAWMADAQLWNNLIHPEDRARVLAEDLLTNKTGAQLNIEYRLVHRDGHLVWVHEEARLLRDASGLPTVWQGIMLDFTERKQREEQMTRLNMAVDNSGEAIFMTDREGVITFVNPGFTQLYGYTADEIVGKTTPRILKSGVLIPEDYAAFWQILLNKQVVKGELTNKTKDGQLLNIESWSSPILNQQEEIIGFLSLQRDITARKQAEERLHDSREELYRLLNSIAEGAYGVDTNGNCTFVNRAFLQILGYQTDHEVLGKHMHKLIHHSHYDGSSYPSSECRIYFVHQNNQPINVTDEVFWRKDGVAIPVEYWSHPILKDDVVIGSITTFIDITARKQAEEQIKSSNDELSMLFTLSHSLAEADNLDDILGLVNRHAVESIHTTFARIALLEGENYIIRSAYPIRVLDHDLKIGERNPVTSFLYSQLIMEQNEPMILRASDPGISNEEKKVLLLDFAQSLCLVPLRISDSSPMSEKIIGLLMLGEARNEGREPFTAEKMRLAQTIGDSAAIAIRRMLLREQTERNLQQLIALSKIDLAIISSSDMVFSLGVLLLHAMEQLNVDAADVWLFNPTSQMLEFVSGRGFRTPAFENAKPLHLGEGNVGRAALERRTIHIPNLTVHNDHPRLTKALAEEPFISYYAVPLIVKGQVKGVLELFHRTELESNEEWLKFLNTLANQAAIAIDNSSLFSDLQHSNAELTRAYDATIQGWSRALDLRDNETEGHTQRVTELTMKLGRQFGLSEEELVHVRRGALLHDIGKMGVPDGILLKPGPLTDEEWVMMRKHTTFAYEMLSPIQYLHAALDIPYCHHEKWDGTGYPRGLSGEQIPFAARIFAVVDVWDALTSDRPYRLAWPEEKVLDHIRSLAGTHFNPQVVKVCLESGLLKGHT
jgi:PAS domain S-box-containing protein/putative nucleotidyltransferase with HDIG domain